ncbi:MAG TPA: hypothetical protein VK184_23905 [Nostocaceae cyanobacterium]|nr:hypothetical protein [Nostocaceae cyanobacterium]
MINIFRIVVFTLLQQVKNQNKPVCWVLSPTCSNWHSKVKSAERLYSKLFNLFRLDNYFRRAALDKYLVFTSYIGFIFLPKFYEHNILIVLLKTYK